MSKHAVGTIVSLNDQSRIGKIVEVFAHWRPGERDGNEQLLYHVWYYDLETGLLMKCPDDRCTGKHTCPIHGANKWAEDITPMSESDLEWYRKDGLIKD